MQTIKINVVDKVATAEGNPFIVCGNSDYTIAFNFDKAWDGYNAKTARFSYEQDGEEIIAEVPFAGNSCKAPVIHDTKKVFVGVYAGDILSTTRCGINCKVSILDGDGIEHEDPPADVYNEIVNICNDAVTAAVEAEAAATEFEATSRETFANAVKGSAEGEIVRIDDVSPVEHNVAVKVEHADLTSVTVTRCGKNLINHELIRNRSVTNGITITREGDIITLNGALTANSGLLDTAFCMCGGVNNYYTLSYQHLGGTIVGDVSICIGDSNLPNDQRQSWVALALKNGDSAKTFQLRKSYIRDFWLYAIGGAVFDNFVIKLQFEKGNNKTEYETSNFSTYTPNADGTIEGITSLSPTMTLLTDNAGAVIHCEYNKDTNRALAAMKTADGTVVSQNADFAEVAEWADGNPDNEDRTGYFVCANVPVEGIVMRKATSIDDVKGVSILAPAFAGNYSKDKLDSNGNLLPKYSYVAIIGFVPVIDNGTCTVGGRCMPDDNGCAIPSSNSMGYQVVKRIDENRVLIIIEPNGDMVQRIKAKINDLQAEIDELEELVNSGGSGGGGIVDQTFKPESTNAQSGVAVAEALTTKIVSLPSPSGIFNLETNKIYSFGIYSDVAFELPQVDDTKLNSIELQVRISGYENLTIDLGTTKYFGDIPELSDGYYIIYYEHNGQDWCVGALEIVGA